MKLHEKHRNGAKVQKIYYPAKTPFQRLRAALGIDATEKLSLIYQSLDPVELLRQIRIMQDALWKYAVLRTENQTTEKNDTARLPEIQFQQAALNIPVQDKKKNLSRTESNDIDQQKRKYRRTKAIRAPRTWRTRKDPFQPVWNEICDKLEKHPESTAKSLFVEIQKLYPDQYPAGQLRTLQRRIQEWRAKTILTFDNRWLEDEQLLQEGLPRPLRVKLQSNEATGK